MEAIDEGYVKRYVLALKDEADEAKQNRMELNRANYDQYQLKHDFSHKAKGQSTEVLSKVRNATESSKAFFQQALADLDDWFRVTSRSEYDPGGDGMPIKPEEMQCLLKYFLKQADYFSHVGASVQSGLLGSLSISKVHGVMVPKPKFKTKSEGKGARYKKHVVVSDDKTWELRLANIRQEDYYPDATGSKLFEIEECEVDMHVVKALADGDNAIYDKEAVNSLKAWGDADLQAERKARETGQNVSGPNMRPKVKLTTFWGTIVDEKTGDILAENIVCTLANHEKVIQKPTPNPLWHQRNPIVAAALIEFANSVWGIAMMDAGSKHTKALTEIFNLMLDSAFKAVWGISQIRTDVLSDVSQVTDGIKWGTNFKVDASLPPGAKVMEQVITGEIPSDVINMFNLLNTEALSAMKTNDLRMGAQSMRAVKATEVVAAENSITSEFQGIAKNFEEKKIKPELELSTYEICQNWDRIDSEIFISLFGKRRGEELSKMEPQDVFVATVNGMKFEVFGISLALRRQADFRKWTTFMQIIGASEPMIEAFLAKYSFEKLLGEVMTALDLNKMKIQADGGGAPAGPSPALAQPGGAPGAGPQPMTQIPAAANTPQGGLAAVFSGQGNSMNMPAAMGGQ